MLLKEQAEEEMRELADTVEIATLDKEMAEEKVGVAWMEFCAYFIVSSFHSIYFL